MRVALSLLAVLASASVAVAEPTSTASTTQPTDTASTVSTTQPTDTAPATANATTAEEKIAVALGTNLPFMWSDATSVGVSGYIGFAKHHAIRINVASYKPGSTSIVADILADGDEAAYLGRTSDIGIGYQYFTRGIFEGWTLEAGAFRRAIDTTVIDDFATNAIVETKATGFAGRGLVGYSWLWERRVFLSTAVGASVGRYTGAERTADATYMPQYSTAPIERIQVAAEAYLRVGLAFGL